MSADGKKQAFCEILWKSTSGGDLKQSVNYGTRGLCTRPFDCFSCQWLQQSLANTKFEKAWWVCHECAKHLKRSLKEKTILPGYFGEGFCQNTDCWNLKNSNPAIPKFSIVLQLIIMI